MDRCGPLSASFPLKGAVEGRAMLQIVGWILCMILVFVAFIPLVVRSGEIWRAAFGLFGVVVALVFAGFLNQQSEAVGAQFDASYSSYSDDEALENLPVENLILEPMLDAEACRRNGYKKGDPACGW